MKFLAYILICGACIALGLRAVSEGDWVVAILWVLLFCIVVVILGAYLFVWWNDRIKERL